MSNSDAPLPTRVAQEVELDEFKPAHPIPPAPLWSGWIGGSDRTRTNCRDDI